MKSRWVLILIVTIVASCTIALLACANTSPVMTRQTDDLHYVKIADGPPQYGVLRVVDYEAGVACWLYVGFNMVCFPLGETGLKGK